MWFIINND